MKIIISKVKGMDGQTLNILLTKQNIRISWHESETGVINWVLEFLSNSSSNSNNNRKMYFSFALDGSKDDMKGWLNKSYAGSEDLQYCVLMPDAHIQP